VPFPTQAFVNASLTAFSSSWFTIHFFQGKIQPFLGLFLQWGDGLGQDIGSLKPA
jgi:hypothetical protein